MLPGELRQDGPVGEWKFPVAIRIHRNRVPEDRPKLIERFAFLGWRDEFPLPITFGNGDAVDRRGYPLIRITVCRGRNRRDSDPTATARNAK